MARVIVVTEATARTDAMVIATVTKIGRRGQAATVLRDPTVTATARHDHMATVTVTKIGRRGQAEIDHRDLTATGIVTKIGRRGQAATVLRDPMVIAIDRLVPMGTGIEIKTDRLGPAATVPRAPTVTEIETRTARPGPTVTRIGIKIGRHVPPEIVLRDPTVTATVPPALMATATATKTDRRVPAEIDLRDPTVTETATKTDRLDPAATVLRDPTVTETETRTDLRDPTATETETRTDRPAPTVTGTATKTDHHDRAATETETRTDRLGRLETQATGPLLPISLAVHLADLEGHARQTLGKGRRKKALEGQVKAVGHPAPEIGLPAGQNASLKVNEAGLCAQPHRPILADPTIGFDGSRVDGFKPREDSDELIEDRGQRVPFGDVSRNLKDQLRHGLSGSFAHLVDQPPSNPHDVR